MALTATANTKVRKDILENLKMTNAVTLEQSFNRPNLYYEVRPKRGGKNLILDIFGFIAAKPKGSSGIIYCSSQAKCEEVAQKLRDDHQLRAYHYHAGMNRNDRVMVQTEWQEHKFEIIVATVSATPSRH
jgi:bloom syndrome protein